MEVRWRLFARDVLSMHVDADGGYLFGAPLRKVRGLRYLGVVVYRSQDRSLVGHGDAAAASKLGGQQCTLEVGGGSASSAGAIDGIAEEAFGILGVDDSTGVVEVRIPLHLWTTVALWDQVDIVGRPESVRVAARAPGNDHQRCRLAAEGCHVETDPNVAMLRALECINLYKACYFSRAWSPTAVPVPSSRPDRFGKNTIPLGVNLAGGKRTSIQHGSPTALSEVVPAASLEERLLEKIGSMAGSGGATSDELNAALGLPPGHSGAASALAQMQLDGVIYLTGDRFVPL